MREHHEIDLPAGRIRYADVGEGPPLLFVHGLLFSGLTWRKVVPLLDARFRCIVPDWPIGAHTLPMRPDADLSPVGLARTVLDLCDALGLDRVTLIGNDTGTTLAQLVALERPELVERLVLTNGDAYEHFPPPIFRYLPPLARVPGALWLIAQSLRLRAVRRLPIAYGWASAEPLPEEVLEAQMAPARGDRRIRHDLAKVLRGIDREITRRAAEGLPDLRVPVLLAWAHEDRLFPPALAERLAADLPDARLRWIEGSRMLVPEDAPEALAEHVLSFVGERAS